MTAAGDVWFFDRFAPLYDRLMADADAAVLRAGLDLAERDVVRALDVGGGTGRGIRALEVPDPVVVDASRPMLREARAVGLDSVQGDAGRLPVAADAVDAVLIVDALHHMPAVDDVLAAAERVLRPGGVLVVREVDPSTLRGRAMRAVEHVIGFGSTFLTPGELTARMEAAGLEPAVPEADWAYTAVGVAGGRRAGERSAAERKSAAEDRSAAGASTAGGSAGPER